MTEAQMNKLLLIDDEEGIRLVYKRFHDLLEPVFRGQLEMDVASDFEQGKHRIATTVYDAIICDLKFKGQGSEETTSWLFENADKLPPVIILTGDVDIWTRRRCMMAGAASFWIKMDAAEYPDLFFKDVFNRYLARLYATTPKPPASSA